MGEPKVLEKGERPLKQQPPSEKTALPVDTPEIAIGKSDDDDGLDTPYLQEVREIFRQLVITEKNLGLYPAFSRVVKESLEKLVQDSSLM